jgi:methylamine---glutamate N-methyltransferase subunit B
VGESMMTVDCAELSTRRINEILKDQRSRFQDATVKLINPDSRHNLAVGITNAIDILFDGNVGYYCAGLCDGVTVTINGDCGWGLAENLMSGKVTLTGSAGSSAGATIRGGLVSIHGNAGARCGIAMKGGTVVVGGNAGYMTGFMMQKGVIIVCGDAGEAFGDSIYEGTLFVRGKIKALGSDAVESEVTDGDLATLSLALDQAGIAANPADFKKVVSGRKLYNFNTREKEIWKLAL